MRGALTGAVTALVVHAVVAAAVLAVGGARYVRVTPR